MSPTSDIFKTHYTDYLNQIGQVAPETVSEILGIETEGNAFYIPFMGTVYEVSPKGSRISQANDRATSPALSLPATS